MGLFGFGKSDDHGHASHGPPPGIPVDRVIAMRQQGLSNNQAIQILQREGYETTAIFDAMNQADIKGTVEVGQSNTIQLNQQNQFNQSNQLNQQSQNQRNQNQLNEGAPMQMNAQQMNAQQMAPPMPQDSFNPQMQDSLGDIPQPNDNNSFGSGKSPELARIEELAEAIIEEKWNEIVRSINKIVDWKDRIETRLTKLEQEVDGMKKDFDTLHQGVLGKIGQYDQNLTNIGAEIKAMDMVFQKVLPVMTQNVNELSRITRDLKSK